MLVTLTENAGEKLKVLLAEEADEGDGLRVQVVPEIGRASCRERV